MRPLRLVIIFTLLCAAPARAVITFGDDPISLSAPANGAPWDHVAQVGGSASAVYLGNGFLLTAAHVNVYTAITPTMPVFLNNVRYDLDPTYGDQGVQFLAGVDLKVLKIAGDPGLSSLSLTAPGDVDFGKAGVVIGWGVGMGAVVQEQGWLWGDNSTLAQRWGTNTTSGSIFVNKDENGTVTGTYLETLFDRGVDSEAQLTLGDSGGGLFEMSPGGVWKLAGIADLAPNGHVYYDNDPAAPGDQPDAGYYLRMETYRAQILAATSVPEPAPGVPLLLGAWLLAGRRAGRRQRAAPS
jgi:hypothetical protein